MATISKYVIKAYDKISDRKPYQVVECATQEEADDYFFFATGEKIIKEKHFKTDDPKPLICSFERRSSKTAMNEHKQDNELYQHIFNKMPFEQVAECSDLLGRVMRIIEKSTEDKCFTGWPPSNVNFVSLRAIVGVAAKVYLDKYFEQLRKEQENGQDTETPDDK